MSAARTCAPSRFDGTSTNAPRWPIARIVVRLLWLPVRVRERQPDASRRSVGPRVSTVGPGRRSAIDPSLRSDRVATTAGGTTMDARRFDSLVRGLARPASRRNALAGGLLAALGGVGASRVRRPRVAPGTASSVATPEASLVATPMVPRAVPATASPGPLDLLVGGPAAEPGVLGRGGTCMNRRMECPSNVCGAALACSSDRCCSGTRR